MELSINTNYFQKRRNTDEKRKMIDAVKLVKNAGYRFIDCTPDVKFEGWEEDIRRLNSDIKEIGMTVDQSHAPFNRYGSYTADEFPILIRRQFETAVILCAKTIVIHTDEYPDFLGKYTDQKALQYNYDFYAPYIEFAKKNNLKVAIECVFNDGDGITRSVRYTSKIEELLAIVEKFNDPFVGICWDFGHAEVSFGDKHIEALKQAGKYLISTHVHDNYYSRDLHVPPFFGKINWEEIMKCLKDIGYNDKFTYEFVYGCIPDALLDKYLEVSYITGKYLLSL